jgi:23S rRNA pseudouridine955/2504/2580 synthase
MSAAPEKVALIEVSEDEAGMRLDRWFHRRFPKLPQSHLNKIVRKGEVRVSGKRADRRSILARRPRPMRRRRPIPMMRRQSAK